MVPYQGVYMHHFAFKGISCILYFILGVLSLSRVQNILSLVKNLSPLFSWDTYPIYREKYFLIFWVQRSCKLMVKIFYIYLPQKSDKKKKATFFFFGWKIIQQLLNHCQIVNQLYLYGSPNRYSNNYYRVLIDLVGCFFILFKILLFS